MPPYGEVNSPLQIQTEALLPVVVSLHIRLPRARLEAGGAYGQIQYSSAAFFGFGRVPLC